MKTEYKKGQTVTVKYGNFGQAVILDNGRKNTFNHEQKIYKVQNTTTGAIDRFNELHFTNN